MFEFVKEYITADPKTAGLVVYAVLYVLLAIVYQLGFAQRLPILKALIIYIFIGVGSFILLFLSFRLPIIEGLLIAVLLLIVVRIRQRKTKPFRK